jgi:hypothetical protein
MYCHDTDQLASKLGSEILQDKRTSIKGSQVTEALSETQLKKSKHLFDLLIANARDSKFISTSEPTPVPAPTPPLPKWVHPLPETQVEHSIQMLEQSEDSDQNGTNGRNDTSKDEDGDGKNGQDGRNVEDGGGDNDTDGDADDANRRMAELEDMDAVNLVEGIKQSSLRGAGRSSEKQQHGGKHVSSVARLFDATFKDNGKREAPLDPQQHRLAMGLSHMASPNISRTSSGTSSGIPGGNSTGNNTTHFASLKKCEVCPPGKYSSLGDYVSSLADVLAQKHSLNKGEESADLGWEVTFGTTSCNACPPGKMAPKPKSSGCVDCPLGQYAADVGTPLCSKCPAGYQQLGDGSGCEACVAGKFSTGNLYHHQQRRLQQHTRQFRRLALAYRAGAGVNSSSSSNRSGELTEAWAEALPPIDEIREHVKEGIGDEGPDEETGEWAPSATIGPDL